MGIIERLTAFSFLQQLDATSQALIEEHAKIHTVQGRLPLVHKGDRVGGIFLVQQGALRVYNISAKGRESTLYWVEGADSCIFAISCVFSDVRYPAWVESDATSTTYAIIPPAVYRSLFEKERAVQKFTFDVLSNRIFELMTILEDVTASDLDKRLANFLVKKADDSGTLNMSHEEVAVHLGTAREVITRTLRKLTSAGLVYTERGTIKLVNASKLAQYPAGK